MSMKRHILAALQEVFDRWEAALAGLNEAWIMTPPAPGAWSLKDEVVHLWAWQQRSCARLEAAQLDRAPVWPPWPPDLDDATADQVNAWLQAAYRDEPWAAVYQNWRAGFRRLLELGDAIPEPALLDATRYAWMNGHPLAFGLVASYDHHQEHLEKLLARLAADPPGAALAGAGPDRQLQPIVDFILELDKLKAVTRKTRPLGLERYENSAEHSWQLALLAAALVPHAALPVDTQHVIGLLLVHDVGEIDTGDTIVYAEEGWAERKAAERAAVTRIFGQLPGMAGAQLLALWQEFEDAETPAARFAHAVDRAMPALLNLANNGQSWRENGISHERVVRRIGPPIKAGCPALWTYLEARLADAHRQGWFGAA